MMKRNLSKVSEVPPRLLSGAIRHYSYRRFGEARAAHWLLLIAADRGAAGEGCAARLRRRLVPGGLEVRIVLPDPPFGDWNEAAVAAAKGEERGS